MKWTLLVLWLPKENVTTRLIMHGNTAAACHLSATCFIFLLADVGILEATFSTAQLVRRVQCRPLVSQCKFGFAVDVIYASQ